MVDEKLVKHICDEFYMSINIEDINYGLILQKYIKRNYHISDDEIKLYMFFVIKGLFYRARDVVFRLTSYRIGLEKSLFYAHAFCDYAIDSDELKDYIDSIYIRPKNLFNITFNNFLKWTPDYNFSEKVDKTYSILEKTNLLKHLQNVTIEQFEKAIEDAGQFLKIQVIWSQAIDAIVFITISENTEKFDELILLVQSNMNIRFLKQNNCKLWDRFTEEQKEKIVSYELLKEMMN